MPFTPCHTLSVLVVTQSFLFVPAGRVINLPSHVPDSVMELGRVVVPSKLRDVVFPSRDCSKKCVND